MAWRKERADVFPVPLRVFREQDWPPVPGECLEHYACRADGYENDCAPLPGVPCGQACYELLARDYPDRPEVLAAAKRADAYTRYHRARLNWLGEDADGYVDEMIAGWNTDSEIRYAPFAKS
jgi:hypothetical protein